MAWEYFEVFLLLFSLSLKLSSFLKPPFSRWRVGWLSLFFISTKNFPSGFTSMGQKTDHSWRLLPGFFNGPWHVCAEGRASEHYQPSQAVLAIFTFFFENWAQKCFLQNVQFSGICYVFWWETVEKGRWERFDPGWLNLIRRQISVVSGKVQQTGFLCWTKADFQTSWRLEFVYFFLLINLQLVFAYLFLSPSRAAWICTPVQPLQKFQVWTKQASFTARKYKMRNSKAFFPGRKCVFIISQ